MPCVECIILNHFIPVLSAVPMLSVKSWRFLIPRVPGRSDYLPLDSRASNIVDPETSAGKAILYQCSRASFPDAILNNGFHIPSSSGCWLNVDLSDNAAINTCLVSLFNCKGLTLSFWILYENSLDDQNIMELSNGGIRVLVTGSGGASPSTSIKVIADTVFAYHSSATEVPQDSWHHLTVTWANVRDKTYDLKLYKDGCLDTSTTEAYSQQNAGGSNSVMDVRPENLDLTLDDIMLWPELKDADFILKLYTSYLYID